MTEEEWLRCDSPTTMLLLFRGQGNNIDRKYRLFACACCCRVWNFISNSAGRNAVSVAEMYADSEVSLELLNHARMEVVKLEKAGRPVAERRALLAALSTCEQDAWFAVDTITTHVVECEASPSESRQEKLARYRNQVPFVRDIFGNPFRPLTLDPSWLTSTVLTLAQQMYESRDFSPMPILADALQDAGCENEDVLDHCRGPGPHVRGCWLVDLLTGRK
jgi:hypothetical protein